MTYALLMIFIFADGDVYQRYDLFKTLDACEVKLKTIPEYAAKYSEILSYGAICTEIKAHGY